MTPKAELCIPQACAHMCRYNMQTYITNIQQTTTMVFASWNNLVSAISIVVPHKLMPFRHLDVLRL